MEVPPGTHTLSVQAEAPMAGSIYRAALAYGWGCAGGLALSGARCKDFATVTSSNLRVNKRAGGGE